MLRVGTQAVWLLSPKRRSDATSDSAPDRTNPSVANEIGRIPNAFDDCLSIPSTRLLRAIVRESHRRSPLWLSPLQSETRYLPTFSLRPTHRIGRQHSRRVNPLCVQRPQ